MQVLIVDDEQLARQRIRHMLEDIAGFACIGEAANGEQALQQIESLKPDIVLLDIRMPGMDGMQVAENIQARGYSCKVVFTTAYSDYAIDAFEVNAQGYLLKPVNKDKLAKVLNGLRQEALGDDDQEQRHHLSASSRGSIELIPIENVRVLMAEHKYVTVYHTQGESILDDSLKSLETEFSKYFIRVHRNALVSIAHIESLDKNAAGQYELRIADCDVRPAVSRRLVSSVRNRMKQL